MPRQKLSEYRAKYIVSSAWGLSHDRWAIDTGQALGPQIQAIPSGQRYVVKVDEGVKGRFKKGLVRLGVSRTGLRAAVEQLQGQGYRWCIVEPEYAHDAAAERYISLERTRTGVLLRYTAHGGVDVESHAETIRECIVDAKMSWQKVAEATGLTETQLHELLRLFDQEYMSLLEINPYIVDEAGVHVLDAAMEVDDAGSYFVQQWSAQDVRRSVAGRELTVQERAVQALDAQSPASLKLEVINPDGAIFLLLSGGGASVAVADEVYNHGYGQQLANYGEYSGNPDAEETYLYTKAVLELLLASKAHKKVLFIGGAVANFTDVAATFAGVIQAIELQATPLRKQGVRIFVRRGGPRQEVGLQRMQQVLEKHGLFGAVHSPDTPLTTAIGEALQEVGK